MYKPKSLEKYIMQIFEHATEQELRWSQIRNHLFSNDEVGKTLKYSNDRKIFSVKLSRSLNRLYKNGFLKKRVVGHKNVRYYLSPEMREEMLKKMNRDHDSKISVVKERVFTGIYTPGCSLEEMRTEALKQWIDRNITIFETEIWPELKKEYEWIEKRSKRKSQKD